MACKRPPKNQVKKPYLMMDNPHKLATIDCPF
jgi:hypothetical protein